MSDEDVDDFNPLNTIRLFVKYVDHLIITALEVLFACIIAFVYRIYTVCLFLCSRRNRVYWCIMQLRNSMKWYVRSHWKT